MMPFRWVPDALSVARVPASLGLIAVYEPRPGIQFWISMVLVIIIIISDILDGRIARQYAIQSEQGYVLDGWGDRAFHIAIYLIFFDQKFFGIGFVWILVFREVTIYAVRVSDSTWHSTQTLAERLTSQSYAGIVRIMFLVEIVRGATQSAFPSMTYRTTVVIILCMWNLASYGQMMWRFMTSQRRMRHE